jgi:hypothetical protein
MNVVLATTVPPARECARDVRPYKFPEDFRLGVRNARHHIRKNEEMPTFFWKAEGRALITRRRGSSRVSVPAQTVNAGAG